MSNILHFDCKTKRLLYSSIRYVYKNDLVKTIDMPLRLKHYDDIHNMLLDFFPKVLISTIIEYIYIPILLSVKLTHVYVTYFKFKTIYLDINTSYDMHFQMYAYHSNGLQLNMKYPLEMEYDVHGDFSKTFDFGFFYDIHVQEVYILNTLSDYMKKYYNRNDYYCVPGMSRVKNYDIKNHKRMRYFCTITNILLRTFVSSMKKLNYELAK